MWQDFKHACCVLHCGVDDVAEVFVEISADADGRKRVIWPCCRPISTNSRISFVSAVSTKKFMCCYFLSGQYQALISEAFL